MDVALPPIVGAWLARVQAQGIKLGQQRIVRALELAGDPQQSFPSMLVGGTNGKGSAVAFASALLREAGHCVGSTYSPHLTSYRERFVIDGELASWDELEALARRLEPLISAEPEMEEFTFFELGVLLALSHFFRSGGGCLGTRGRDGWRVRRDEGRRSSGCGDRLRRSRPLPIPRRDRC